MKTLVLNGSPRGQRSNSFQLTEAFLEGLGGEENKIYHLSKMKIKACQGCFACWKNTPGQCTIRDDMAEILADLITADIVIWSFPLYYYSVPGILKNLIDRQLPTVLPFMEENGRNPGSGSHPSRYDRQGQRHVLISTCGFYSVEKNYDSVIQMFEHFVDSNKRTDIFCGQGELFSVPELRHHTSQYLEIVKIAGQEFKAGSVTGATKELLKQQLYPKDIFEKMADASWGIDKDSAEKSDDSLFFTRQMAALYNRKAYDGKERVVEFYYTDLEKKYQLWLGKDECQVVDQGFKDYTTRIETPYTVWVNISQGKISGSKALMEHQYRVLGDFNLMINWEDYFNGGVDSGKLVSKNDSSQKKTNMSILLTPWIVIWVLISINTSWGGAAGILISSLVPFLWIKYQATIFESITVFFVTLISLAALTGSPELVVLPISYSLFGLMWLVTGFLPMPLTAHYSKNGYGGERIMNNPIFIRTNRILTICWGVLYLFTAVWTYFILKYSINPYIGAINSIMPFVMGGFTRWFQKWYPVKVGSGS